MQVPIQHWHVVKVMQKNSSIPKFITKNQHLLHPTVARGIQKVLDTTDTLEFNANMEGDWFFHCHILYHMMSGMGRVFTYQDQSPNPLIPNRNLAQRKLFAEDRKFHFMAENDFANNGNDGMVVLQNTRWSIGSEWRLG